MIPTNFIPKAWDLTEIVKKNTDPMKIVITINHS